MDYENRRKDLDPLNAPQSRLDLELILRGIWSDVLKRPAAEIGIDENFFALGGDSILVMELMGRVHARCFSGRPDAGPGVAQFFTHGTIRSQVSLIADEPARRTDEVRQRDDSDAIAVIGMACRVPGASDPHTFWSNLCGGVESITPLSESELLQAGTPASLLAREDYVKAIATVSDVKTFDAGYFGMTPQECALTGPEQRLLIECCEEAMQNAGYGDIRGIDGIGVFVGTGLSSYLLDHVRYGAVDLEAIEGTSLIAANTNAAARVSYVLNLTGPSVTVDTACSSSLVAVHQARMAILSGECTMALAGGATVRRTSRRGYRAQEGGIFSQDGHCRPFSPRAGGTVPASGGAVVVLKRLSEALADHDHVYAVIRGSATNSDGGSKAGYTAPSAAGQADVIRRALKSASVRPEDIQYLEAHGTGTVLGDRIEAAALEKVFPAESPSHDRKLLGAVKANVGHLEAAAGIVGLMKTILAVHHGLVPPSIHHKNGEYPVGLEASAFDMNAELRRWPRNGLHRYAGVSSFGIGGGNAHVVVESITPPRRSNSHTAEHLLIVSAHTESALRESCRRLAVYLNSQVGADIADIAYTLQVGRRAHRYRHFIVASTTEQAATRLLEYGNSTGTVQPAGEVAAVAFLLPGQGAQYAGMMRELYELEPAFRTPMEACSEALKSLLDVDLEKLLSDKERLSETLYCQPALFCVEYALARMWQSWGVNPSVLAGHSLGEYVAACLSGVFSLESALKIVTERARLMQSCEPGSMIAVRCTREYAESLLGTQCSLAAVNGPRNCVIGGPPEIIEGLRQTLDRNSIANSALRAPRAFHSTSMIGIAPAYRCVIDGVQTEEPKIPYISNVTGEVARAAEARSSEYWGRHLFSTVEFASGLQVLSKLSPAVLIEVGPGRTLLGLARSAPGPGKHVMVATNRGADSPVSERYGLLMALGTVWQSGVPVNWEAFNAGRSRHRVPLPPSPLERKEYWLPAVPCRSKTRGRDGDLDPSMAAWLYVPTWRERQQEISVGTGAENARAGETCILINGPEVLQVALRARAQQFGMTFKNVVTSDRNSYDASSLSVDRSDERAYDKLLDRLQEDGHRVGIIVHCESSDQLHGSAETSERRRMEGVDSISELARAVSLKGWRGVSMTIVSTSAQAIGSAESLDPYGNMRVAIAGTIEREIPGLGCKCVDVSADYTISARESETKALVREVFAPNLDRLVVLRGNSRWLRSFEPLSLDELASSKSLLESGGVYILSGGLGGIGWTLGRHIGENYRARLALIGRTAFPEREHWKEIAQSEAPDVWLMERIAGIEALEQQGAEVLVIQGDVTNQAQMESAVALVHSRFGRVDGVIHAAGVPGAGSIHQRSRASAGEVMAPKVKGTQVLFDAVRDMGPKFFVCCSSIAAVRTPSGLSDYSAANAFQDAFCRQQNEGTSILSIAIGWDAWRDVGFVTRVGHEKDRRVSRSAKSRHAIQPEEGVCIFDAIMRNPHSHCVVSRGGSPDEQPEPSGSSLIRGADIAFEKRKARADTALQGTELIVAEIWQELLGVAVDNVNDDFFALGGDSLSILEVRTRLEILSRKSVPLKELMQASTIADMAKLLSESS